MTCHPAGYDQLARATVRSSSGNEGLIQPSVVSFELSVLVGSKSLPQGRSGSVFYWTLIRHEAFFARTRSQLLFPTTAWRARQFSRPAPSRQWATPSGDSLYDCQTKLFVRRGLWFVSDRTAGLTNQTRRRDSQRAVQSRQMKLREEHETRVETAQALLQAFDARSAWRCGSGTRSIARSSRRPVYPGD